MKAALIPPIPHLHDFGTGQFHLLLTHLLKDKRYKTHYIEQRKQGAYLVLDNSAHEKGRGEDPLDLLRAAFEINAQEVVVPDVLDNADATIEACLCAHEEWFEGRLGAEITDVYNPALMYVPQGKDYTDWRMCFDDLLRVHHFCSQKYNVRRDLVVGISKDYEVWDGGLDRILSEVVSPRRADFLQRGVKMHVHLLGWGRQLWKLNELARLHPWIRSTDSAKPFVFATARKPIDLLREYRAKRTPTYPTRPKDYFEIEMLRPAKIRAKSNVWVFQQCAEGQLA